MKKPMELPGAMRLYVKSMGKLFRVFAIAESTEDANDYCRKHSDAAVIAEESGRIYIACQYSSVCPSSAIPD